MIPQIMQLDEENAVTFVSHQTFNFPLAYNKQMKKNKNIDP